MQAYGAAAMSRPVRGRRIGRTSFPGRWKFHVVVSDNGRVASRRDDMRKEHADKGRIVVCAKALLGWPGPGQRRQSELPCPVERHVGKQAKSYLGARGETVLELGHGDRAG